MARNLITALDVGTSTITTVVAEGAASSSEARVIGLGAAPAAGIRRGVVVDIDEASAAVRRSLDEARRAAGVAIKSVWLGVDGSHVTVSSSRGVVAVSRADQEISPEDVRRALAAAETFIPKNHNREVLHLIPRDFRVDNESGIKDPVGMHGMRLEVDALIVECAAPALKNLFKCAEAAGVRVEDYVFAPLAAAEAVLTKRQKELGVILLDIGGGVSSFIVYEEGTPIHAGVIPIGGNHITGDIAIGFRAHVDAAEEMKCAYGACLTDHLPKRDSIRLAEFIPEEQEIISRRALAEIIEARLQDLFELLQKELRRINRVRLLPAGVVLTGGSSRLPGIAALTKREVGLPAELGLPQGFSPSPDERIAPALAVGLGLIRWAGVRGGYDSQHWGRRLLRFRGGVWQRWLRSLLP